VEEERKDGTEEVEVMEATPSSIQQRHKDGLETLLYHVSQMKQGRIDLARDLSRELREGRRSVEEILRECEEAHNADLDFLKVLLGEMLAERGIPPKEVDEE